MRCHPIGALNDFFPVKQLFEEANTAYKFLGPVVQKVDSGIHRRDKSLSEDKAIGLRNIICWKEVYLLDSATHLLFRLMQEYQLGRDEATFSLHPACC